MRTRPMLTIICLAVIPAAVAALPAAAVEFGTYTPDQFREYWYHRGAEISRFVLEQVRYGEMHQGDAVFVFVTEPMNPVIQIKADEPRPENIPVLKLNATRKFFTGIYPYSIMTSIFTPVDIRRRPLPLKISTSVQEWCGHVYMQLNLREEAYRVRLHSYFENEGDQDFRLAREVPEDAVWNMIRIAPETLPRGAFAMIPGTVYARLKHRPLAARKAVAVLSDAEGKSLEGHALVRYEIRFPEEQRILRIDFEKTFPFRIQEWEEAYPVSRGGGTEIMTTRAVRTHTLMNAYWQHNSNEDRDLLEKLGLSAREMGD